MSRNSGETWGTRRCIYIAHPNGEEVMTVKTLQERVPLTAQVVGIVVVMLYAIGFVILSLHHASFGILEFNPLRPKILLSGVLFCVFIGLPIMEAARVYGLLGYDPMFPKPKRTDGEFDKRLYYRPWIQLLAFLISTIAITWLVRTLMQDGWEPKLLLWSARLAAPAVVAGLVVRIKGQERPVMCAWFCLVALG